MGSSQNYPNPMFEKWPWSGHATRKTGSCNVGLAVSSEAKQARRVAGMIWPPPRRNDEHIRGMGYDGIHLVDCLSDYRDGCFCWPISSYFHEYLEQLYWRLSTSFHRIHKRFEAFKFSSFARGQTGGASEYHHQTHQTHRMEMGQILRFRDL